MIERTVDSLQKHITANEVMMQIHMCTAETGSGYGINLKLQKIECNLLKSFQIQN